MVQTVIFPLLQRLQEAEARNQELTESVTYGKLSVIEYNFSHNICVKTSGGRSKYRMKHILTLTSCSSFRLTNP